jgi:hypothetical protein
MARRVEEMGIQEYQDHTLAINDQPDQRFTDDEMLDDWKRRAGGSTAKLYVGPQETRRAQIKSIRAQYNNGRVRDHGKRDSSGRKIGRPDTLSLPYDQSRQPYAYDADWLARSLDCRSPTVVGLPVDLPIGLPSTRGAVVVGSAHSQPRQEPSVKEYALALGGGSPGESAPPDWLPEGARSISAALVSAGLRHDPRFPPSAEANPEHIAALQDLIENEPMTVLGLLLDHEAEEAGALPAPTGLASTYFEVAPPMPASTHQRLQRAVAFFTSVVNPERTSRIGRAGEQWVLALERMRLTQAGREDLAMAIDWTASTQGPWPGYDIASFEVDGTSRCIEVKTTPGPATRPFFVSANEVQRSSQLGDRFWLYRVHSCFTAPRLYTLRGSLEQSCGLIPSSYEATPLGWEIQAGRQG